ncbi:hypothetical protein ACSLNA_25865, partial [Escherichia coli]|uniref:hypothetical protein n=1 Tax=Escherichia coli TaxID=562 RepID=UPI003EDFE701
PCLRLAEIAGILRPCLANLRQKLLKGRRGINTLQWWMLTDFARSDERNSSGKMTMPLWIQGY